MKKVINFKTTCVLWIVFSLLNYGCKEKQGWVDAVIIDLGSPAVDGCGFVLKVNSNFYYPVNLNESYQIDEKKVKVRFSMLEDMHPCGFPYSETKFQKVDIRDIKGD